MHFLNFCFVLFPFPVHQKKKVETKNPASLHCSLDATKNLHIEINKNKPHKQQQAQKKTSANEENRMNWLKYKIRKLSDDEIDNDDDQKNDHSHDTDRIDMNDDEFNEWFRDVEIRYGGFFFSFCFIVVWY